MKWKEIEFEFLSFETEAIEAEKEDEMGEPI